MIFREFVSLTCQLSDTIVRSHLVSSQYTCMADKQLKELEKKIDELITLCQELNRENQALKNEGAGWQQERQDLLDKNELARNKVEAMIGRLRAME